jgi:HemY protein
MTKLFTFLLVVTIAAFGAMWFIENDGSVVIEWLGYRIQTSVAFMILAGVIALTVLTILLQLVLWLQNFPKKYSKAMREKKREQGLTALTEGFAAIAAGDILQANRLTKQAIHNLGNIPLTKLLAAQSAQLEGNNELAKVHYTAMLENKETEIIAIKGLLLEARKEGDLNKAMFLAEKALNIQPNTPWAISVLIDLYKITGHWDNAEETIRKAAKLNVITSHESKRSLALIARAKSGELFKDGNIEAALEFAKNAYKLMPDFAPIANNYAKILLKSKQKRKAIKVLEKSWKEGAHPRTAKLYMEIFEDESETKRVKHADRLVELQPSSIYGHIEVAKVMMNMGEFDEARNELKSALEISPTRNLCKFMAELERVAGNSNEVKQWQQRSDTAHSDASWNCVECGHTSSVWSINCKQCNGFDTLEWGQSLRHKQLVGS